MAYDEALADEVRNLLADEPGVEEKRMFGGLAFLIGGYMAVAASGQDGLMVRVEPEETEALLGEPGAHPFEMRGRELRGWLHVDVSEAELAPWVTRGVEYARSLPPKSP